MDIRPILGSIDRFRHTNPTQQISRIGPYPPSINTGAPSVDRAQRTMDPSTALALAPAPAPALARRRRRRSSRAAAHHHFQTLLSALLALLSIAAAAAPASGPRGGWMMAGRGRIEAGAAPSSHVPAGFLLPPSAAPRCSASASSITSRRRRAEAMVVWARCVSG